MRASRAWLVPAAILVAVAAGCSNTVVNTGEKAEQTEAPPPAAPTRPSNDKLVNAFDFFADTPIGDGGYYFISPSGAWRCVIVARMWAGCQSAGKGTGGFSGVFMRSSWRRAAGMFPAGAKPVQPVQLGYSNKPAQPDSAILVTRLAIWQNACAR